MYKKVTGNREYKDNVFRLLFGDEVKSAELYNAIKGTNYTADTIKMNTLQNPFFFGDFRNDISFTVEDKLIILIEHQSSVNPNMGLRCLLYLADLYEVLIDKKAMYKESPISIANPEFYVLYNGKEPYPEKAIVKLSDLFKERSAENNLELIVTVYNVNNGQNKEIMERSRTLNEYAIFVDKVNKYTEKSKEKSMAALTAALKVAVADCINEDILQEFLMKHGGDIVNTLLREWNLDDFIEVRAEERAEKKAEKKAEEKAQKMAEAIAENLLRNEMSKEFVMENTGLSIEQVEKIIKRIDKSKQE
jgi:predicted transposase/invertase (TIGR01784 family)